MRVAVVGSGIVGLSAARFVASLGHQVEVFEQFDFAHNRGSSHGRSRIVRRAYPDPFYAERMALAYPMWRDLEDASGESILHEVGLVYFGDRDFADVRDVANAMAALDVPHEIHGSSTVRRVFPALRLGVDETAVYTPEAGYVRADLAIQATHALATRLGVTWRFTNRVDRDTLERDYDAYIVAPGPWITEWVDLPVERTLQTFVYLDAQVDGPVWIRDGDQYVYGFPSDELGLKAAPHRHGPVVTDLSTPRDPSIGSISAVERTIAEIFGISAPVRSVGTCIYTNLPNDDFRVGRLGTNGFYASACSGHGFKFGPYIGKLLAEFATGADAPENHVRWQA